MNGLPYYPRYPRDFFEGTAGMPFELKGSYGLVLDLIYMMGDRGLPDDPHFISGHLGMSVRKWNTIRKQLIDLGKIVSDRGIISNKKADKVKIIQSKYRDKQAENRSRPNKNKDLESRPDKESKSSSNTESNSDDDGDSAQAREREIQTFRERMLTAIGVDPTTGLTGHGGAVLGTRHDMDLAGQWQRELGLDSEIIVAVIGETMAKKPDGKPPNSFKYFNRAMQREAARRDESPLTPEESHGQSPQQNRKLSNADAQRLAIDVAGRTRKAPEPDWL